MLIRIATCRRIARTRSWWRRLARRLSPVINFIFTEELELGDLSWDGTDYTNLHTLQLMKFDLNGEMIAENILGQQGDYSGLRSTLGLHDRWTGHAQKEYILGGINIMLQLQHIADLCHLLLCLNTYKASHGYCPNSTLLQDAFQHTEKKIFILVLEYPISLWFNHPSNDFVKWEATFIHHAVGFWAYEIMFECDLLKVKLVFSTLFITL